MNDQPAFVATMTLIIEGAVRHEYPLGSCFSCGGSVLAITDKQGLQHEACVRCGPVRSLAVTNDAGALLQGFLSVAEFKALPPGQGDGADNLP